MIRALVVDDEAPARRRLRTLLAGEADVTLIGECEDGTAAVEAITQLRPDLLFLDIQMPEMSGFEVLRLVGVDVVPSVVFVTAYDQYALQAFDAHALDYLLKPFANDRFHDTLTRVRRVLARQQDTELPQRLAALLDRTAPGAPQRIAVKTAERVILLDVAEIDRLEGAGNYVRIHASGTEHLVRDTLKNMSDRLDPEHFVRVHHSHIVNLSRVRELRPWTHGEYVVVLVDGTRIASSRTYSEALRRLIRL